MPHSAIDSGCVDFVLPPEDIAREIARIGRHPFAALDNGEAVSLDNGYFIRIVALLRQATGVDFGHYKANTRFVVRTEANSPGASKSQRNRAIHKKLWKVVSVA